MDAKENQPQNLDMKNSEKLESVDITEIIKSINDEKKKGEYEIEKFQNDEDVKKIKRKGKKLQKEVGAIFESNRDAKDKLDEIFSRFQKLITEAKTTHERYHQVYKTYSRILGDRKTVQDDLTKLQGQNTILENFCKDLQKKNQDLIEENKKLQNDEKELRSKLAEDFQNRINTISTELEEQAREHMRKSKENELIKEKLKEIQEKYESREKLFTEELTNRADKFENHYKEIQEKFQSIEAEANKVDEYSAEYEKVKSESQTCRDKLKLLTDKSDAFQNLMSQTNAFFSKIKSEMEKISQKSKKLDDENIDLQKKSEKSNMSIFGLIEENVKLKKELLKTEGQKEGLQNLIQTLNNNLKEKNDKIQDLQGSV